MSPHGLDSTSLSLVLASAFTHAYWNYLARRSGGGVVFIGLSKVAEAILFAPVLFIIGGEAAHAIASAYPVVVVGAALTLANYVMLGMSYRTGNLSRAYPISRASALLVLPVLGYLAFDERLSAVGWIAVVVIAAGIVVLRFPVLSASPEFDIDRATLYAALAGVAAACYTIWDKHAIQSLNTFGYFYSYTAVVGACYGAYLAGFRRDESRAVLTEHRWPIIQVAILNTVTYAIVLLALRGTTSSYVIALRQLSIPIGAYLGYRLLGERIGKRERIALGVIVTGCLLVGFAR